MRGRGVLATGMAGLALLVPASATAAPLPPGAVATDNLEYVKWVPDTRQVVEGKFDRVRGIDVLVLTGRFGFKTLDVSDPTNPQPLDSFLPAELNPGGYWQNEDMELDTKRKLIIGALDPRHTTLGATATSPCPPNGSTADPDCRSGFYVISYADPANLRQVGDFVELPSGHTSSCIQDCRYIWTGGPARSTKAPGQPRVFNPELTWLGPILGPEEPTPWTFNRIVGDGRPIWVTDLTDPQRPRVSDQPVDLWRNDQFTDYSHDVDEDERGIAWVSGRGGIRGYATKGWHRDPYQNRWRKASPFDPILVAGGGVEWDDPADGRDPGTAQVTDFMHNSGRPTDGAVRASGVKKGSVLIGTEEDFTTPCGQSGRIVSIDLTDSWGGEPAQQSTLTDPYRMTALDSFHPFLDTPETANPALGCSAHYFEIEGPMLGAAWYGQGLRLLDIHDARELRQVGYYRVTNPDQSPTPSTTNPSSNSWDVAFRSDRKKRAYKSHRSRSDLIYLFDMSRGVEVLRLKNGARHASKYKKVTAPSVKRDRAAARVVGGLGARSSAKGSVSYVCPLFAS
jgi:hypothetical protein